MQRVALGAVTDLYTRTDAPPEVRVTYRKRGLRHILLTAVGAAPTGVIDVDTSRVQITEASRSRKYALTVPTRAVRAVTTELTRPLLPLIVGILLLVAGLAATALAIAESEDLRWWPSLQREVTPEQLFLAAGGIGALSLLSFLAFGFRREVKLTFDAGGSAGGRIRLRRSLGLPLRLHQTLHALEVMAYIVLVVNHPVRTAPTPAPSDTVTGPVAVVEPVPPVPTG